MLSLSQECILRTVRATRCRPELVEGFCEVGNMVWVSLYWLSGLDVSTTVPGNVEDIITETCVSQQMNAARGPTHPCSLDPWNLPADSADHACSLKPTILKPKPASAKARYPYNPLEASPVPNCSCPNPKQILSPKPSEAQISHKPSAQTYCNIGASFITKIVP